MYGVTLLVCGGEDTHFRSPNEWTAIWSTLSTCGQVKNVTGAIAAGTFGTFGALYLLYVVYTMIMGHSATSMDIEMKKFL
jgi:hypothetical protein